MRRVFHKRNNRFNLSSIGQLAASAPFAQDETKASHTRFSIVVTSYNQREFIASAVESALDQSLQAAEVIVVDDGSTDGSAELLKRYDKTARVVLRSANEGAIAARNHGAAMACGDYVIFLDGDDLLVPWTLQVYDRVITKLRPVMIVGRRQWFERDMPALDLPSEIEYVAYDAPLSKDRTAGLGASSLVIERRSFERVGMWTPGIFHLDLQDLYMKLGEAGTMVLITEPRTAGYRIHAGNSIHSVSPFVRSLLNLLHKERTGQYRGGTGYRLATRRRAWLGGLSACWIRRALAAGLFGQAVELGTRSVSFITAALICRAAAVLRGRQPIQKLPLHDH